MLKQTLSTVALIGLLAANAQAASSQPASNDSGFFFKPYVGADYEYTSVDYNNVAGTGISYGDIVSDSFNGGDVHVGARIHKYLGFEASYFDTASSSKSGILGTTASTSTKYDGYALDAMGYLPIDQKGKFELIGTVGYGRLDEKGSVTVSGTTYSSSGWENVERIGGGAQYWLTDNLNVRGLLRYENLNDSAINSAVLADIGVNWQF